jgi:translation initiation factor IF-2
MPEVTDETTGLTDPKSSATAPSSRDKTIDSATHQREIKLPPVVLVSGLADAMGVDPVDVVKQLMRNGVMAAINQAIDVQSAAQVAAAFGFRVLAQERSVTNMSRFRRADVSDQKAVLQPRAPVVTILGHVDHGKTTLLDHLSKTDVVSGEAGGITQHIGANQVEYRDQVITFLDTPGHEAFTAMRERGAQVTDIAVLVVAADDGVMPQTVEALNHARAANVPILVAINKMDKPGADTDKVKRQLSEHGLLPEDWGGDSIMVPVSALSGDGVEDLIENILALAEIAELKADYAKAARGVVIEAKMDKSRGPVATLLVQDGTLKTGQTIIAGFAWGRIKAMGSDRGVRRTEAGPSTPIEVLGLNALPRAGDLFVVPDDERVAKEMIDQLQKSAEAAKNVAQGLSLADVSAGIHSLEVHELPLIVKCDVQGSTDAVRSSLERLSHEGSQIRILHAAAGTVNESDVLLATASKAIIVGFNTRVEPGARQIASQRGVDIRLYDIIYRLSEDMEQALAGLFEEPEKEVIEAHALVRTVFGIKRRGRIAGCQVSDGVLRRGALVRVVRDGEPVHVGPMSSLKRFKDDVREVATGYECGVGLDGFGDFQENDILESFRMSAGK